MASLDDVRKSIIKFAELIITIAQIPYYSDEKEKDLEKKNQSETIISQPAEDFKKKKKSESNEDDKDVKKKKESESDKDVEDKSNEN
ncbi:hypothetical protein [Vibrio splendidus]|uniref:hypothetical protein n=1 Tax=Vibrio splendidus TaxID=29497 RepID=UPI0006CA1034|nr:hypothetical protein [Vibrio splendidus]KPL99866.1 hypothetical protein AN167_10535 [Vibrio splendidus]